MSSLLKFGSEQLDPEESRLLWKSDSGKVQVTVIPDTAEAIWVSNHPAFAMDNAMLLISKGQPVLFNMSAGDQLFAHNDPQMRDTATVHFSVAAA